MITVLEVYLVLADIIGHRLAKENCLQVKALSHGAIFPATCNAILLLRDVN